MKLYDINLYHIGENMLHKQFWDNIIYENYTSSSSVLIGWLEREIAFFSILNNTRSLVAFKMDTALSWLISTMLSPFTYSGWEIS